MRHLLTPIVLTSLLVGGSTLSSSCLSDEQEERVLSNETAITQIDLDDLTRTLHTRTRDGLRDSSYSVTVAGAYYPLTIDQERGLIYNVDSLPLGTQTSLVKFKKFSAVGNLTLRALLSESDTAFSREGIDLSHPRQFTLRSLDGKHTRRYTLELRVHQQDADGTHWQRMSQAQWDEQGYVPPTPGQFRSSTLWWKVEGQQLLRSADGQTWQAEPLRSTEAAQLPTANIVGASLPSRTSPLLEDLLLYGTQGDESRVWKGSLDLSGRYQLGWNALSAGPENRLAAPVLTQPQLVAFDDGFLLLGLNAKGQLTMLHSIDRGRTWKAHKSLRLPSFAQAPTQGIEALVDAEQHLWIRTQEGEVWRGHINRLLWKSEQKLFFRSPSSL